MYTQLAPVSEIRSGPPRINAPAVFGASPEKPILYRIPVLGQRPMRFTADLPEGLEIDSEGVIRGSAARGEYSVTVRAENGLGCDEKTIHFRISPDSLSLTPLLGWTSWNAFRERIDSEVILDAARAMHDTGVAEFGYSFVNIDSDWQGEYGGKHDAILPGPNFPDMGGLVDRIHALGLKCGIYSTPMRRAFGIGTTLPGCTRGEDDPRFATCFPIGTEHLEQNNVDQWVEWGFDYLKYDWFPDDIENAALMKDCLRTAPRDLVYCVTVRAEYDDRAWYRENCNSFRICRDDSDDKWETVRHICFERDRWLGEGRQGGWCDLDMLELGFWNGHECRLTPDEQVVAFTARVIFPSPIQLSCDLRRLSDFDMRLFCNEAVLAVNQDSLGAQARLAFERHEGEDHAQWLKVYEKPLQDGKTAVAVFNIGQTEQVYSLPVPDCGATDLWAKEQIPAEDGCIRLTMPPHTARLFAIEH